MRTPFEQTNRSAKINANIIQTEDSLDKILYDCIVKIDTRKTQGTGFFVAPRKILTCAHIIPRSMSSPRNFQAINIFWPTGLQQRYFKISSNRNSIKYLNGHDLVVIEIDINISHSYIYWDENILVGDELYSYGFPKNTKRMEKITGIQFERVSDNQKYLVLKNIQPGFDGAPLFNKRTRKICGIIKNSYSKS